MTNPTFSRRTLLGGAAALPFAAAVRPAFAAAHMGEAQNTVQNTFALGDFQVSTLLAGTRTVEDIQSIFGTNVPPEEFEQVSQQNFIPADKAQFFFTPTVVRTGNETVLFDTGPSPEGMVAALAAACLTPEEIDVVVLTHMHGDHIGGMAGEGGAATFPNARYVTGQVEFDHWNGTEDENFAAKVKPFAEQFTFLNDGGSVVSGLTAVEAFGHTPGHMAYMLESGGEQVLVMADTANHYVWSLAYPEWEVRFDADKAMAAETRKKILGMVAADRHPLIGYHMPFPGMGYVTEEGPGKFHYVPTTYQMML